MSKVILAAISESAANPFLSQDGLVDLTAYARLDAKVIKANKALEAANAKLDKPARLKLALPMLCTRKPLVKFTASLDKKGDHKYKLARGQQIKTRTKLPAAGSNVKIKLLLTEVFEGVDKTLISEVKKAHTAASMHNRKALKQVDGVKNEKAKIRDAANAEFDTNVAALTEILTAGGIKPANIVVGQSMFGKVVHVKLPNGGVVTIGKSDDARLRAAKKTQQA